METSGGTDNPSNWSPDKETATLVIFATLVILDDFEPGIFFEDFELGSFFEGFELGALVGGLVHRSALLSTRKTAEE